MALPYPSLLTFVQHLTPTWRVTQQRMLAQVVRALIERPTLRLAELARALPNAAQPLHGRYKRLDRWLASPRLDELALVVRWLRLASHFVTDLPDPDLAMVLPVLLDTTYFEPYAVLLATVPAGGRGLPIAWTTYHRTDLLAAVPPPATWPRSDAPTPAPARCSRRSRGSRAPSPPAAAQLTPFLSQNQIEEHLLTLLIALLPAGWRPVIVADRGFARASLFRWLQGRGRDFVIRFDAQTGIQPTSDHAPGRVDQVLDLHPGERVWLPQATYHAEERVPVAVLGVWEAGQAEPWYLASTLPTPEATEQVYRWRTRTEQTHRDDKTGVLLREGGDAHHLTNLLHLHRLVLTLCVAFWLCALVGLQAWHDLPTAAAEETSPVALEMLAPTTLSTVADDAAGPAPPPPVVPHRGARPPLPTWMRRFALRGPLSYVRLGLEVLRAPDLGRLLTRVAHWLGRFLWSCTPLWRPAQWRYRLRHWWPDPPAAPLPP